MREPTFTLRARDPMAEEALRYLASMRSRESRRIGDKKQQAAKATIALAEQFSQWRAKRQLPWIVRFLSPWR